MRLSFVQEVLLAVAAGLGLLLLVEVWLVMPESLLPERQTAVEAESPQTAPSVEDLNIFALPPRESLRAFVERPLFEKTRRTADAVDIADITLIGVVIASDGRIALLRTRSGAVRVRAGDAVGDWRVVDITQNSVLLRNDGMVQWVSLGGGG